MLQHFFGLRASYYEAPAAAAAQPAPPAAQPPPRSQPAKREPVKLVRPKAKVTALFNPALGRVPPATALPRRVSGAQQAEAALSGGGAEPQPQPTLLPQQGRPPAQEQLPARHSSSCGSPLVADRVGRSTPDAGPGAPAAEATAGEPSAPTARQLRRQQRRADRQHNRAVLVMLAGSAGPEPQAGKVRWEPCAARACVLEADCRGARAGARQEAQGQGGQHAAAPGQEAAGPQGRQRRARGAVGGGRRLCQGDARELLARGRCLAVAVRVCCGHTPVSRDAICGTHAVSCPDAHLRSLGDSLAAACQNWVLAQQAQHSDQDQVLARNTGCEHGSDDEQLGAEARRPVRPSGQDVPAGQAVQPGGDRQARPARLRSGSPSRRRRAAAVWMWMQGRTRQGSQRPGESATLPCLAAWRAAVPRPDRWGPAWAAWQAALPLTSSPGPGVTLAGCQQIADKLEESAAGMAHRCTRVAAAAAAAVPDRPRPQASSRRPRSPRGWTTRSWASSRVTGLHRLARPPRSCPLRACSQRRSTVCAGAAASRRPRPPAIAWA